MPTPAGGPLCQSVCISFRERFASTFHNQKETVRNFPLYCYCGMNGDREMWLSLINSKTVTHPHSSSPRGSWRFGTLGLLWVPHANVVLDPTWCAPEQCFLLTGPLFGSPIVKACLNAEENRKCPSLLTSLLARTHTIPVRGIQTHIAEVVLRSIDSWAGTAGCFHCWRPRLHSM